MMSSIFNIYHSHFEFFQEHLTYLVGRMRVLHFLIIRKRCRREFCSLLSNCTRSTGTTYCTGTDLYLDYNYYYRYACTLSPAVSTCGICTVPAGTVLNTYKFLIKACDDRFRSRKTMVKAQKKVISLYSTFFNNGSGCDFITESFYRCED